MFEIKSEPVMVEAYHYDLRDPKKELTTNININLTPMLPPKDLNYPENNSILGARLTFILVFPNYSIQGSISQVTHVINRKIEKQEDLKSDEVEKLVAPLFDIVKRLTYEVTEIALDQPGVTLNFESNLKSDGK